MVILDAFKNSFGELYSWFSRPKNLNVEKYTGILVKEKIQKIDIDINGDEIGLNRFIKNIKSNYIDFFIMIVINHLVEENLHLN